MSVNECNWRVLFCISKLRSEESEDKDGDYECNDELEGKSDHINLDSDVMESNSPFGLNF